MRKIFVLGDLILDKTVWCHYRRQSPENVNVPVLEPVEHNTSLGGAGNVGENILSLGHPADKILGFYLLHADEGGEELRNLLGCAGYEKVLDTHYGGITPTKTRFQTSGGVLFRVDEGCEGKLSSGYWNNGPLVLRLKSEMETDIPPVVCLVDYNKGYFTEHYNTIFCACLKPGVDIVVDPGRHGQWDRFSSPLTTFKANVKQAQRLYSANDQYADLESPLNDPDEFDSNDVYAEHYYEGIASRLVHNLGKLDIKYKAILLTLGAGGAMLIHPGIPMLQRFCTPAMPVIDVTGAGDTFMAAVAVELARFDRETVVSDFVTATRTAVEAAGVAVQLRGCATVTPEAIKSRMK